jgi:hypothetical protein
MNYLGLAIIFLALSQAWFFFSPFSRISTAFVTSAHAGGGLASAFSSWIAFASRQLTASVALSIAGMASASSVSQAAFSAFAALVSSMVSAS